MGQKPETLNPRSSSPAIISGAQLAGFLKSRSYFFVSAPGCLGEVWGFELQALALKARGLGNGRDGDTDLGCEGSSV